MQDGPKTTAPFFFISITLSIYSPDFHNIWYMYTIGITFWATLYASGRPERETHWDHHSPHDATRSSATAVIADRTACSILTLFIVIATSRPLNKKIRSLSVRGSNNYCGSASANWRVRSPHTSAALTWTALRQAHALHECVIVDKRAVCFRLVCLV